MQLSKAEVEFVEALATERPTKKRARNMYLNEEQFDRLQAHCSEAGLAVNKVVDALIGLYLDSKTPHK